MLFSTKLRKAHDFENDIKEFIKNTNNVNEITNMFHLIDEYGITILTTISNVIAGSHPELALKILKHEESMTYSQLPDVSYTIGDFELNPIDQLKNVSFTIEDFVCDSC
ncbi:MAG: hypothetical protein ACI8ZF_000603 [Candidatus Midichloriaceae bacterium]|jgi:hypothetical protein